MSNPIKREYDKMCISKDIAEREDIIRHFQKTGYLDRDDAIKKIRSIQITDSELALATKTEQSVSGSVNLYQADNSIIIANIQFQIDFLKVKLAKLELEGKENG